jgi:hypothetical protein
MCVCARPNGDDSAADRDQPHVRTPSAFARRGCGGVAVGASFRRASGTLIFSLLQCPSLAPLLNGFSIAVNAEHEKAKKDFITQKKMSADGTGTRQQ